MFKGIVGSIVRCSRRILMLGAVGMLAACGGGGGSDDGDLIMTVDDPTISVGESTLLFWNASGLYTSCTLGGSGGLGTKAVPRESGTEGFSTGVIETAGTYTFTLTCTGSFGTGVATATLTVSGAAAAGRDCGVGAPTQALLSSDGATVTKNTAIKPADLCVGCSITGEANIITKDPEDELVETYASIDTPISFNKATEITVTGASTYPAGRPAGFLISTGSQALLSGDARRDLTVQTLLNGTVSETYTTTQTSFLGYTTQPVPVNQIGGEPFTIDIFGKTFSSVPNGTVTFIGFNATKPYNAIRLGSATKLSANELRVYAACVGK